MLAQSLRSCWSQRRAESPGHTPARSRSMPTLHFLRASHVQLQKVLTLCVKKKKKGRRQREVGSSRLRPSQIKVQQLCNTNAPPPPGTARSPSGKSTKNWRVRTAAKFPLLVAGKPICLKMLLGQEMLRPQTVRGKQKGQRPLQVAHGTWTGRILPVIHKARSANK